MSDPAITPQPWWTAAAAAFGGFLFTVRWLVGFGGRAAQDQIKNLSDQIRDLKSDLDEREDTIVALRDQVAALTVQVALLTQQLQIKSAASPSPPQCVA
ncbi:hypothetical protein HLH26_07285 [Gluconacetobacter sp. 1b LMG 1731]|uniref:Uncharacterized protein n=1 Tax=Gluconacetobacter dulcium TaxID=2729096 RepID=A0A7W4IK79_9PROT|nr:hypothetical protein [Gluconacetobacter dulcium]MBB2164347.1 hypothetical protein [Gluconacetobacter dulcium]MBB2193583.1 hypothetical protein [Gluconacetobacter dulcium]